MTCVLCKKRKAKRQCPAVHGEICALCCGTERENTLTCPLDCTYLQEAHRYEWERNEAEQIADLPHARYEINDNFLYHHEPLVGGLAVALIRRAMELPATQDSDLIEALNGLIKTRETMASGLIYESVPSGPVPAALYDALQKFLEEITAAMRDNMKDNPPPADTIVKALVFVVRLGVARGNKRPRSRAFMGFLYEAFPQVAAETPRIS